MNTPESLKHTKPLVMRSKSGLSCLAGNLIHLRCPFAAKESVLFRATGILPGKFLPQIILCCITCMSLHALLLLLLFVNSWFWWKYLKV